MNRALLFVSLALLLACCSCGRVPEPISRSRGGSAQQVYSMGGASPQLSNPYWNASFFFDPQNTTGCASDQNNGTSSTCGASGVGPLKTYKQAVYRWNGCPTVTADVTYDWLSGQTDGTDPVAPCPVIGLVPVDGGSFRAPSILYKCELTQIATDTLNVVTPKNYTTPQDLRTTFTSGTLYAIGDLVQNTTHSSMSLVKTHLANANMTQPLTPLAIPRGNGQGWQGSATEVDTWTAGDSVTVFTLPQLTVVANAPTIVGWNSNGMVQFAHCMWPDWGAAAAAKGSDGTTLAIGTDLGEMWSDRALIWNLSGITAGSTGSPMSGSNASATNVLATGGMLGGNTIMKECFDSGDLTLFGGSIITNINQQSIQLAGAFLDGDISLSPAAANQFYGNGVNLIGSVEVTKQINLAAGAVFDLQIRSSATGTNRLWGAAGVLNAGYGRVTWSPTSTATIALGGLSGGLKLENGTVASSDCGGTINAPITLNVANLDTVCDAGFGATAARASLWGGGSFTSSIIGP